MAGIFDDDLLFGTPRGNKKKSNRGGFYFDPLENMGPPHAAARRQERREERREEDDFGSHDMMKLAGLAVEGTLAVGLTGMALNSLRNLQPQ